MCKKYEKIKEELLSQRQELLKKYSEEIGIDTDGDETDEIQANMLMAVNNQILLRNKEKIYKIDEALSRLDNNTYGSCEDCEEEIAEKRLAINPYFTTCIICSEAREKEASQRKRATS